MIRELINGRRTNIKVFQIVFPLQHHITRIPNQVERQQPVYLLDALGRMNPFDLEFVRSAEVSFVYICLCRYQATEVMAQALVAVLKINFTEAWQRFRKD